MTKRKAASAGGSSCLSACPNQGTANSDGLLSAMSMALAYAGAGLHVLPLTPRNKTPLIDDWPSGATTDKVVTRQRWERWPDANIGIHVGKSDLVVIDVDPRNGGDASMAELRRKHGDAWLSSVVVKTGGGGRHYFYRQPSGAVRVPPTLGPGVDVKRGSSYVVAPGSIHPSGAPYEIERGGLLDGELDFLPTLPEWMYEAAEHPAEDDVFAVMRIEDPETPENVERVKGALEKISADCSRDEWRDIGFALMLTEWGCAEGMFRDWSMTAPHRFEEAAFRNIVDSAKSDKRSLVTLGTLFAKAKANGWVDPRVRQPVDTYGDISNGRRFADKYRHRFLFCHATGEWFVWDGQRWKSCENGEEMAAAKLISDECITETSAALRDDASESRKRNFSQALAVHRSIRRLEAMLQAASSEPGMSIAHPGLFDANPWMLAVRNGLLNLRTGELIEARPEMLISRQAGAEYDRQATCPQWERFLSEAMQGDTELVAFLQRVFGYALTGSVNEEKLFMYYGHGSNGKSVAANVANAVHGEYAVTARAALLARDPKGGSSDAEREKARLPGARLVLVNETAQGDVFDDQRLKEITSRERISARYLHQESFDFFPTHKLFVRSNHQPGALDSSDGFWRRIVLIGFNRQFREDERIPDLDQRIVDEELPGVLAWMVRGCLDYQRQGLRIPPSIKAAVATYRSDTDLLGEWIAECCSLSPGAEASLSDLFRSYERFMREANAKPPSRNAFGRQLAQRGYTKRPSNGRTLYRGIQVRSPFADEGDEL